MNKKVIAIASDHAGYDRKQTILKYLEGRGIAYKDYGCHSSESCDYPDFAHPLADAISKGEFEFGLTFCGSGQGISITANKHQGVRSAICWSPEIARLSRLHNDANVCSIPGRFVTDDEAVEIVKTFLNTGFEGGRHERRIKKIPVN